MVTPAQKYRQAALTYLVYGMLYLGGAVYLAQTGVSERTMGPGSGLGWYLMGALFVLVFPVLIWKGFKWFTRILALLVIVRMIGLVRVILEDAGRTVPLPGGAALPMVYGAAAFLLVAAVTCFMLIRAGWDVDLRRRPEVRGAG